MKFAQKLDFSVQKLSKLSPKIITVSRWTKNFWEEYIHSSERRRAYYVRSLWWWLTSYLEHCISGREVQPDAGVMIIQFYPRALSNQRPVSRSCDQSRPMRSQYFVPGFDRCKNWRVARIFAAISPQMITTIDQVQGIWSGWGRWLPSQAAILETLLKWGKKIPFTVLDTWKIICNFQ